MTALLERPVAPASAAPAHRGLSLPRALLSWVGCGLALAGIWVVAFALWLSGLQEHSDQSRLYAQLRQQLAEQTAPTGPVADGLPVALLAVPRLGLDAVVVEGTRGHDLAAGPGHLRSSALPGQLGTAVLLGKSMTYGRPFAGLARLRHGDAIVSTTAQGRFRYVVQDIRRPGDPLPTPLAAGQSRLVLGSVEATGWRARWAPMDAVYVDALLSGPAQTGPPRPAVSTAELPGRVDASGLVVVLLWLQLLVVGLVVTAWAAARWGRWQTWLAAGPAVLAVVWLATGAAAPLLPNVM